MLLLRLLLFLLLLLILLLQEPLLRAQVAPDGARPRRGRVWRRGELRLRVAPLRSGADAHVLAAAHEAALRGTVDGFAAAAVLVRRVEMTVSERCVAATSSCGVTARARCGAVWLPARGKDATHASFPRESATILIKIIAEIIIILIIVNNIIRVSAMTCGLALGRCAECARSASISTLITERADRPAATNCLVEADVFRERQRRRGHCRLDCGVDASCVLVSFSASLACARVDRSRACRACALTTRADVGSLDVTVAAEDVEATAL